MNENLTAVKILVDGFANKINAPENLLPTYGQSVDGAHPHIEVDTAGRFYYVIVERGVELKRVMASDTDDLLYTIFSDICFSMAVRFELKNRQAGEDGRRQIFSKQEQLLTALHPHWKKIISAAHQAILRAHPFDDMALTRAEYCKKLAGQGQGSQAAWEAACEQYPLPQSG
ncbi:MAG: Imm63 family immunity protein [Chitinophagaceae bacterium]